MRANNDDFRSPHSKWNKDNARFPTGSEDKYSVLATVGNQERNSE